MQIKWVKKILSPKDWEQFYKDNPSYCFLTKSIDGILAAFVIADNGEEHFGCEELTMDELRRVDNYRKRIGHFTRPFTDQETLQDKIRQAELNKTIDKTRNDLEFLKIF